MAMAGERGALGPPAPPALGVGRVRSSVRISPWIVRVCRMGHQVPVILVEHVDSLGHKGQELAVKPGFARNFLVPKRMAVYATEETRSKFKVVLPVRSRPLGGM